MHIIDIIVVITLITLTITTAVQLEENKELRNSIATQPEIVKIVNEEISFTDSIQYKSIQDELKTKNKIIELDNKIFVQHQKELEYYGDYIVAILKGNDRDKRLLRKEVLKAGEEIQEIQKELDKLTNLRKEL